MKNITVVLHTSLKSKNKFLGCISLSITQRLVSMLFFNVVFYPGRSGFNTVGASKRLLRVERQAGSVTTNDNSTTDNNTMDETTMSMQNVTGECFTKIPLQPTVKTRIGFILRVPYRKLWDYKRYISWWSLCYAGESLYFRLNVVRMTYTAPLQLFLLVVITV